MRRLGGYLANGRKPPVRAPFASREKRRRLANRAFEAHALCEKRMPDAPYGIKRGSLSRHLLPGGWLMPRQVDAGSRIRFSAFRGDASNRPFFWSAVSAGDGCPTRYDAPYGNYAWKPPWHLLPGGWPRTRQDRRTLGTESGSAPCRGNISDRPFNRNAVSAKSGCPVRYTEIKRGSLSLHLLPGGWPRTRQDKRTPGMEPGPAPCRGVLESPAPLEVGIRSLVPPRGMRRIDTGSRFARGVRFLRGERGHLAGHKPSLRPLSPFQGPLCRFWAFLRRFSLGSAVSRSSIAIIPTPLSRRGFRQTAYRRLPRGKSGRENIAGAEANLIAL